MPGTLVEFSNAIAEVVERAGASVVGVLEGGREGVSGTIVREGYAVTAEHTIRGQDEITVVLPSGEKEKATVAGRDPGSDIALLKLPAAGGSSPARLTRNARVGELALLIGRRGGEGITATHGIVSALGGAWTSWHGARIERWVRLDLDPFVGFSGGPIVNATGEVMGIATSGPRRSVLTVPAATVERVVEALIERGHVPQPWIGIAMQPVAFPEGSWKSLGIDRDRGLLVVTVAPGSPAEKTGILLGDVIVTIDGQPVRNVRSLQAALDSVGKEVPVQLVRGGKLVEVKVTVGERP